MCICMARHTRAAGTRPVSPDYPARASEGPARASEGERSQNGTGLAPFHSLGLASVVKRVGTATAVHAVVARARGGTGARRRFREGGNGSSSLSSWSSLMGTASGARAANKVGRRRRIESGAGAGCTSSVRASGRSYKSTTAVAAAFGLCACRFRRSVAGSTGGRSAGVVGCTSRSGVCRRMGASVNAAWDPC